ncbi:hypothetical protein EIP91_003556 [Steccherinum ochraceum]|uniref:Uncharacterized protein n=1 Tax=Steccherinum ochraceum TaxID=92696 RepID=A0A4R0RBV2_9APHY|nr:hypothetical protein EIP91_003556 [Steccherinum ochraceum]
MARSKFAAIIFAFALISHLDVMAFPLSPRQWWSPSELQTMRFDYAAGEPWSSSLNLEAETLSPPRRAPASPILESPSSQPLASRNWADLGPERLQGTRFGDEHYGSTGVDSGDGDSEQSW